MLRSAIEGAGFFLSVGPMIGVAVLLICFQILEGNALEGLFAFIIFGYFLGAVPAALSGIVFGITYEKLYQRGVKRYRSLSIILTCIMGVMAAIVFFRLIGLLDGLGLALLPLIAAISSIGCGILKSREIERSRNLK